MPCYSVITSSVVFKIENVELLKTALVKAGAMDIISQNRDTYLSFYLPGKGTDYITIDLKNSKITSSMEEKKLTDISNSIKRAYSLEVINEVAKKQKWMTKKMGENRYQLQRY